MFIIIFIINYFIVLMSYLLLFIYITAILQNLTQKSLNLFQYKIQKFWFTRTCVIIYILFFIIFFYFLRLFSLGRTVDLKDFYHLLITYVNNHDLFNLNFLFISLLFIIVSYIYILKKS